MKNGQFFFAVLQAFTRGHGTFGDLGLMVQIERVDHGPERTTLIRSRSAEHKCTPISLLIGNQEKQPLLTMKDNYRLPTSGVSTMWDSKHSTDKVQHCGVEFNQLATSTQIAPGPHASFQLLLNGNDLMLASCMRIRPSANSNLSKRCFPKRTQGRQSKSP